MRAWWETMTVKERWTFAVLGVVTTFCLLIFVNSVVTGRTIQTGSDSGRKSDAEYVQEGADRINAFCSANPDDC